MQYRERGLQLDRAARGRVPAKSQVVVRETEDGRVRVLQVSRAGADHPWRLQHWQWMTRGKAARERREAAAQTRLTAAPTEQLATV